MFFFQHETVTCFVTLLGTQNRSFGQACVWIRELNGEYLQETVPRGITRTVFCRWLQNFEVPRLKSFEFWSVKILLRQSTKVLCSQTFADLIQLEVFEKVNSRPIR